MFDWYPDFEFQIAATQLTFAMLGMGLVLNIEDFKKLAKVPAAFIFGVVFIMFASPLAAYFYVESLDFTLGSAIGIMIVASLPGGSASNLFTFLARADVALSILLTTFTTVISLVSIPLILTMYLGNRIPGGLDLPVSKIALDIFLTLLLPVLIGMFLGPKLGEKRVAISRWCIRICVVLLVIIIISSVGSGRLDLGAYLLMDMVKIIGFGLIIIVSCSLILLFSRIDTRRATAVALEAIVRNINLGILVVASITKLSPELQPYAGEVLFVVMFYGGYALVAGGTSVYVDRYVMPKIRPHAYQHLRN
jgi:BASS family bile acid:Na+ symporter